MSRISKLLVAQPFTIKSREVSKLSNDKIIALSQAKIKNVKDRSITGEHQTIEVLHNSIQKKAGKYSVLLGLKIAGGIIDGVEIMVTVKNKKKFLFVFLSLVVFLVLASGFLWYSHYPSTSITSGLPTVATEKMSGVELKKYAEKQVDQSNVTVQVYPKISIKPDGKNGKMYVQNIPLNKTGQVVTLKDKATGHVLYVSDLLKPGYQVSNITLNKKLSKGIHQGVVILTFYDLKEEKQVGKANVAVTLTVG